jgi:hypothetical protein
VHAHRLVSAGRVWLRVGAARCTDTERYISLSRYKKINELYRFLHDEGIAIPVYRATLQTISTPGSDYLKAGMVY